MVAGPCSREIDAGALGAAIAAGDLHLVYQPKIALGSGAMVGVEALARWSHPRHGAIPPGTFVALAESAGMAGALTQWVISGALDQWAGWRDAGLVTNVAINVSAAALDRLRFADDLLVACRDRGVPCQHVTIELTESATQSVLNLLDILTRLRLRGVRVSLDDFGTGYSSLAQLQSLPVSELKVDRSFVSRADRSKDCLAITKAVIDLAHNLDLEVVAEGVESEPVLDLLGGLGCDAAQGFHIARPMPGAALPHWVRDRSAAGHRPGCGTGARAG